VIFLKTHSALVYVPSSGLLQATSRSLVRLSSETRLKLGLQILVVVLFNCALLFLPYPSFIAIYIQFANGYVSLNGVVFATGAESVASCDSIGLTLTCSVELFAFVEIPGGSPLLQLHECPCFWSCSTEGMMIAFHGMWVGQAGLGVSSSLFQGFYCVSFGLLWVYYARFSYDYIHLSNSVSHSVVLSGVTCPDCG
jgi:hypothetical protein